MAIEQSMWLLKIYAKAQWGYYENVFSFSNESLTYDRAHLFCYSVRWVLNLPTLLVKSLIRVKLSSSQQLLRQTNRFSRNRSKRGDAEWWRFNLRRRLNEHGTTAPSSGFQWNVGFQRLFELSVCFFRFCLWTLLIPCGCMFTLVKKCVCCYGGHLN